MHLVEGKSEDLSAKMKINTCPWPHTSAKIRCWTMEKSLRYSYTSEGTIPRVSLHSRIWDVLHSKDQSVKITWQNTNQRNSKGSFEPPGDSDHQKVEKWIFILLTGANATPVRNERREILEHLQSRATQILPQTFNYKHSSLGKQGGAAAGRPWVMRPRGEAQREGSTTGLIRSASCPQESEATPASSLGKNIFKTRTEHLRREPKHRERASVQRPGYKTSLKLHSWKEWKIMFSFPFPWGQGVIGIHFSEAIWENRPTHFKPI